MSAAAPWRGAEPWTWVGRLAVGGALLGGALACQPPFRVDGTVFAGTAAPAGSPGGAGALVLARPLTNATVTFRCPGQPTKATATSSAGTFAFGGGPATFPVTCTVEVSAPGYHPWTADFTHLCTRPSGTSECREAHVAVGLVPVAPPTSPAGSATGSTAAGP